MRVPEGLARRDHAAGDGDSKELWGLTVAVRVLDAELHDVTLPCVRDDDVLVVVALVKSILAVGVKHCVTARASRLHVEFIDDGREGDVGGGGRVVVRHSDTKLRRSERSDE